MSNAETRNLGGDDSWETPLSRRETNPKSSSTIIFPKQIFHGLASLLIISLCALLVELNSPGIASRISNRMNFWKQAPTTIAVNTKTANSYYHPVPSPFVAPKATSFLETGPTSEPTQMTMLQAQESGSTGGGGAMEHAPTSEPTEYKDRLGTFMREDAVEGGPTEEPTTFKAASAFLQAKGPTSEPTEFRAHAEDFAFETGPVASGEGLTPTDEPTIFSIDVFPGQDHGGQEGGQPTNEPTHFGKVHDQNDRQPTNEPTKSSKTGEPTVFTGHVEGTGEPTVYGHTGEPTVYGQTGEPTVYGQSGEPTVYGQSGEPTVYHGHTGEPTVFGQGHTGEPTVFARTHTAEPTLFYHDTLGSGNSEPTNEPTVFFKESESEEGGEHANEQRCESSSTCDGGFCNFDEGSYGYCESCGHFKTADECAEDGLPQAGMYACKKACFNVHHDSSDSSGSDSSGSNSSAGDPTHAPSQPPHLQTWQPTGSGSFAPTSDPTIFPTPEPTASI